MATWSEVPIHFWEEHQEWLDSLRIFTIKQKIINVAVWWKNGYDCTISRRDTFRQKSSARTTTRHIAIQEMEERRSFSYGKDLFLVLTTMTSCTTKCFGRVREERKRHLGIAGNGTTQKVEPLRPSARSEGSAPSGLTSRNKITYFSFFYLYNMLNSWPLFSEQSTSSASVIFLWVAENRSEWGVGSLPVLVPGTSVIVKFDVDRTDSF